MVSERTSYSREVKELERTVAWREWRSIFVNVLQDDAQGAASPEGIDNFLRLLLLSMKECPLRLIENRFPDPLVKIFCVNEWVAHLNAGSMEFLKIPSAELAAKPCALVPGSLVDRPFSDYSSPAFSLEFHRSITSKKIKNLIADFFQWFLEFVEDRYYAKIRHESTILVKRFDYEAFQKQHEESPDVADWNALCRYLCHLRWFQERQDEVAKDPRLQEVETNVEEFYDVLVDDFELKLCKNRHEVFLDDNPLAIDAENYACNILRILGENFKEFLLKTYTTNASADPRESRF